MYKTASQLKRETRDRLRGRWGEAVILNLVPTLIRIFVSMIVGFTFIVAFLALSFYFFYTTKTAGGYSISSELVGNTDYFQSFISGKWGVFLSFSYSSPVISILFSYITIGISFTFLDVIRKGSSQQMTFKDAFRLFNAVDFIPILIINILTYLFTIFWSFLFLIPGIVKRYAYSQSDFIYKDLATHENISQISATHIITESRNLMNGHKWRLFYLDISFIGWYIVSICTLGIGYLWISPYVRATKAAFYADIAKDKYLINNFHQEIIAEEEWTSF